MMKVVPFGKSLLLDIVFATIVISVFLLSFSYANSLDTVNAENLFPHVLSGMTYKSGTVPSAGGAVLETVATSDNCAATLSNDLSLNVPILIYHGLPLWADFQGDPDSLDIQLTNFGVLTDLGPFVGCQPSLLSPDLIFHISTILFNGDSFLADFQYSHDLLLHLTGAGQRTGNTTPYQISSASTYQEGCFGPCLCPVTIGLQISGTFNLVQLNPTPFLNRFSLDEISWTVTGPEGTVVHRITGFGIYQTGGEFARVHQLILEVSVDNSDLMHFDSGLVPDGSQFPAISISVDRGTACYDILMNIIASPRG